MDASEGSTDVEPGESEKEMAVSEKARSPLSTLQMRLARGEIDPAAFRELKAELGVSGRRTLGDGPPLGEPR